MVVRGKPEVIRLAVVALLARGHVLIEDVPGVGKTTLAQALAKSIGLDFQRIQFTSDLLPSDIIGVSIYRRESERFEFSPGPAVRQHRARRRDQPRHARRRSRRCSRR